MVDIVLGAYTTEQEAIDAMVVRPEPQDEMTVEQDGDAETPWRIHWYRQ